MKNRIALLLIALCWWMPAYGDKWLPPRPKTYTSHSGNYRLTIFPGSQENETWDGPHRTTTRKPLTEPGCEAAMERLADGHRRYEQVWRKRLVNLVAPVSALVSNQDGSFVTFDNWGRIGWGDDVVVIYTASGELKKKLALTDLVSKAEVGLFARTASSIHWSGNHELDYDQRTLNVRLLAVDGISAGEVIESYVEQEGNFRTIRIDMKTGDVLPAKNR